MADSWARSLADTLGGFVLSGWELATFGEHHSIESGIFEFMAALPVEVSKAGLTFITPTEAVERYAADGRQLPLPTFASTWAGNGGLEFILGNEVQQAVFRLMM